MYQNIYLCFQEKRKQKIRGQKAKEFKDEKRMSVEKSKGIRQYRLRICSVYSLLTRSSREFLLFVHMNLM